MVGTIAQPDAAAPYVFVSYASADGERVSPIVAALRDAGVPVWLDRSAIEGGENYAMEIAEGIEHSAALVLMCSAASLASRNVRQEVALAWKYERPYVPLLLEPVTIPKEIEYWLEAAQWIEALEKPAVEWLPRLLAALAPLGITPAARQDVPVLAGREREQALLRERLAAASGGRGSLVLIGGEAGIGKTTLAEAIGHEAARRGALVLTGRCFDLAETPPYGPWLYLFARYGVQSGLPSPPTTFATPGVIGEVTSQIALFQQVQEFLTAAGAQHPLVLLLDDYHWADLASLDLVRFLAQSVATLPLLIIVTYRVDELTRRHPLYNLLPALVREANAHRIDLKRLDTDAVREVVAARYPLDMADAERLVTYLHERTEGNPFFLGELLRTLEDEGVLRAADGGWTLGDLTRARVPALLRQVIDGRLARLGEEAQAPLVVAAVIGQEVPFDLWTAVVAGDEEALLGIVERAADARIVEPTADGTGFRFVHALIRETLYEGILPLRRRIQHRKIAETLAARPKPDPDAVAYHFQRAGDRRAAEWLIAAGDRAERAYAYLTAAEHFEAALALLEGQDGDPAQQGWILLRLAMLRRFTDQHRSLAYLEAAAPYVAVSDDPALAAYVTLIRGLLRCYVGDVRDGVASLGAGVAAIGALPAQPSSQSLPPSLAVAIDFDSSGTGLLVLWLSNSGRYAKARLLGEQLIANIPPDAAGGTSGHRPHGDTHNGLSEAYAALGLPEQARVARRRARADYHAIGNVVLAANVARATVRQILMPYFTDDIAARHDLENEAEAAFTRAIGAQGARDYRYVHLASLAIEGEWDSAREVLEEMRSSNSWFLREHNGPLGSIARWQGDTALAWQLVGETLPEGPTTEPGGSRFSWTIIDVRLGAELALDSGDLATGRQWLETHDRWMTWSGAVLGQSEGQALWARYHRQAGDLARADEHAKRALTHATDPRQPLALLAAHRLVGELDTEAGRYDDARAHLSASLTLADACAAPFERALTLLAMAELSAATGQPADAHRLVDDVRAICTRLGAKPTLARADALAARIAR